MYGTTASDVPWGGTVEEAGKAMEYETGSWRSRRPVLDGEKCIHCLICWIFCPDDSILLKGEKMVGFRYSHCKGCGICASICPKNAIEMIEGED